MLFLRFCYVERLTCFDYYLFFFCFLHGCPQPGFRSAMSRPHWFGCCGDGLTFRHRVWWDSKTIDVTLAIALSLKTVEPSIHCCFNFIGCLAPSKFPVFHLPLGTEDWFHLLVGVLLTLFSYTHTHTLPKKTSPCFCCSLQKVTRCPPLVSLTPFGHLTLPC